MSAMRVPSEPLIMTTSPGFSAAMTIGARSAVRSRCGPRRRSGKAARKPRHVGAGGEDEIDAGSEDRLGELGVEALGMLAQLAHRAEHRDAPAARRRLRRAEHGEGRAHRGGIGVVALVDELDRAAVEHEAAPLAAAGQAGEGCQRRGGLGDVAADRLDGGEHAEAVHHPVPAGKRHGVAQGLAGDACGYRAAGRGEIAVDQPRRRLVMRAEGDDARDAAARGRRGEAGEMRVVAVEDGSAARLDAGEDLGLGVGDRLDRGEEAEMRRLDRGDEGDMRARDAAQRRELARMVHAEFEDAEFGVARHAGESQR